MTPAQFDALVTLITVMNGHLAEMHAHPNDRPRRKAIQRELDEAIEETRKILVDEAT
jgi:hypothetical protein